MNHQELNNLTADNYDSDLNWGVDEDWVRAAANLEAAVGVDILIGADLRNPIVPSYINTDRLAVVLREGLTDLLSPEDLTLLIAETQNYISERIYQKLHSSQ